MLSKYPKNTVAFPVCLMLVQFSALAHAAAVYTVTGIGSVGTALGINSYGQVCGGTQGGAYLWTPTSSNGTSGALTLLGDLPGGVQQSGSYAINDMGQVIGISPTASTSARTFLWTPNVPNGMVGTMSDPGLPTSYAINQFGQIVGGKEAHAFLWTPGSPNSATGSVVDLGDFPGGLDFSFAYGINALGQVAGTGQASSGGAGLLWNPTSPNTSTGALFQIGGLNATGFAINSIGQIVGENSTGSDHAFLWTPNTPNATEGVKVDLGSWAGSIGSSRAKAINSRGDIVGSGQSAEGYGAVLWSPSLPNGSSGVIINLNSVLDPVTGAGWTLSDAYGINDFGQIVGRGYFDPDGPGGMQEVSRSFLLTPIAAPEPVGIASVAILFIFLMMVSQRLRI